jgi:hypothetical protein
MRGRGRKGRREREEEKAEGRESHVFFYKDTNSISP